MQKLSLVTLRTGSLSVPNNRTRALRAASLSSGIEIEEVIFVTSGISPIMSKPMHEEDEVDRDEISEEDAEYVLIGSFKVKLCPSKVEDAEDVLSSSFKAKLLCPSKVEDGEGCSLDRVEVCPSEASTEVRSSKSGDSGTYSSSQNVEDLKTSNCYLEKKVDVEPGSRHDAKHEGHPNEGVVEMTHDQLYTDYIKLLHQRWSVITASPDCISLEEYMERQKEQRP